MQRNPLRLAAIAALLVPLALGACRRDDQTAAPTPAPAPTTEPQVQSPPPARRRPRRRSASPASRWATP